MLTIEKHMKTDYINYENITTIACCFNVYKCFCA